MRNRTVARLVLLGLAGAVAGCAAAAPPAAAPTGAETTVDPSTPPPPLADRPIQFPDFHESRLENGLRLIVVPHGTQPVANLSLYVLSGGALDPAEQIGRAGMTAELLTKGTTTRSAQQISETIEGVGGSLSASAGNDWSTISAGVLSEHLPLAFELLSDVTLRPTFPPDEVELARRRTLSGLQAQLGQPGTIADRRFRREVYGEEHPYGTSPVPGSIQALRRDDLVAFHRDHFSAENAVLVVSGNVTPAEVESLARRHFGEWRGDPIAVQPLPRPIAQEATRISLVHRPGSVQSNIVVGHLATRPDDPAYFPLQVLNQIVGGGTDSRLFQILREEKGWTYGAFSRFTRPLDVGYFSASAEVRTEVTDSAVTELLHQLRRIRDEDVPAAEFQAARSYLMGSFPLRLETASGVAAQVAQIRLLGLPAEYVTEYRERIAAVTPADLQRAAREYVRPAQAAIVVVGDATALLPQLDPIAPIQLYDVEGRRLEREAIQVRPSADRFDGGRLRAGSWTYRLAIEGSPAGTATSVLSREGDTWVARLNVESTVVDQESELRFAAADLTPRSVRQTMTQGPVRMDVDLTADGGRITGTASMPPEMGGTRNVDSEIGNGTLIAGMEGFLISAARLEEGQSISVPFFDVMGGSTSNVRFQIAGTQDVTVPAGTFPAYRVEVTGGQQPLTMYVRRESPHITLRQEFTAAPITVELQSID